MNPLLDDKSRFVEILQYLPQNFLEDLVHHLKNARLPSHFLETFDLYDGYNRQILSEFSDTRVATAYQNLNRCYDILNGFLQEHFELNEESNFLRMEPRMDPRLNVGSKYSALWRQYKEELDKMTDQFRKAYVDFVLEAKTRFEQSENTKYRTWYERPLGIVALSVVASIVAAYLIYRFGFSNPPV